MKAAQKQLENDLRAGDAEPTRSKPAKGRTSAETWSPPKTIPANSSRNWSHLAQQSAQDAARAKGSDAKVNDLTR